MIALQSLKYKIFEWCIDTFIGKLSNNFQKITTNVGDKIEIKARHLVEGMRISEIYYSSNIFDNPFIFKECIIIDINNSKFNPYISIKFTFKIFNNNNNSDINTFTIKCYSGSISDDTRFFI